VTLDAHGTRHGVRLAETLIRSRHRLHYGEVQEALEGRAPRAPDLQAALETLRGLARALRARRLAAGSLDLDVPEVKAWVDERGEPIRLERRERLESHELIEEFMLLANRCVGEAGAERGPAGTGGGLLYRIHDPPGEPKLHELDAMLKALGLPRLGHPAEPARALQALLAVPLDPPHRRLLHRLVLRSLARARYEAEDRGHFGLAARGYCHFTSPIRRYPDLHNHRCVRAWIRGDAAGAGRGRRPAADEAAPAEAWDPAARARLAAQCSDLEQNAADAEREATKVKAMRVLATRLGDRASGIITGLIPQGFFVELDDTPAEGFVRPSLTLDESFALDPSGTRLVGRRSRRRFTLGDAVEVTVARVDVPARECDLALEAPRRHAARDGRRRRRHGR